MTSLQQSVPGALASLAKSSILVPQALLRPEVGLSREDPSGERAQNVGKMVVREQDTRSQVNILA